MVVPVSMIHVELTWVLRNEATALTAVALSLVINASGMVTNTVVPLLTAEELDQACKKSVAYRPPGA